MLQADQGTGMIRLRDHIIEDVGAILENVNNPNVVAYLRTIIPSPYTEQDAQWWVQEGSTKSGTCNKAIEYKGNFVGNIGASFRRPREPEIGLWLGERYWGLGIGKAAVREFTGYLFDNFDVDKVFAHIVTMHQASRSLFGSCGYRYAGTGEQHICVHAGELEYCIYEKSCR